MKEDALFALIQMDAWDWWKTRIFSLREQKDYAEAEALFKEFKVLDQP